MKKSKGSSAGMKGAAPAIAAADYPAVRDFLRGYLNQDFEDEYGTIDGATKAFRDDASPQEIQELAKEWNALRARLSGASLEAVNGTLSGTFQCGWRVTDLKQLDVISKILQK